MDWVNMLLMTMKPQSGMVVRWQRRAKAPMEMACGSFLRKAVRMGVAARKARKSRT